MADNIIITGCFPVSDQSAPAVIRATESGGVYTLVVSGGGGGVTSVNGDTGAVSVDLASVIAETGGYSPPLPSGTYQFDAVTPGSVSNIQVINGIITQVNLVA